VHQADQQALPRQEREREACGKSRRQEPSAQFEPMASNVFCALETRSGGKIRILISRTKTRLVACGDSGVCLRHDSREMRGLLDEARLPKQLYRRSGSLRVPSRSRSAERGARHYLRGGGGEAQTQCAHDGNGRPRSAGPRSGARSQSCCGPPPRAPMALSPCALQERSWRLR
jgi:hypothetical protein